MSLAVVLSAATLSAANIVTNGGFETGDFSGWSLSGNTGFTFVDTNGAYSGNYSAWFGPVGSDGYLTQVLNTNAGVPYTLSFWLENLGGTPNEFSVSWNGSVLTNMVDAGGFGFTEFTFSNLIGTGSDTLQFAIRDDPNYYVLDSISVDAGAATPEPATLGLIGVALAGIGLLRKKIRA